MQTIKKIQTRKFYNTTFKDKESVRKSIKTDIDRFPQHMIELRDVLEKRVDELKRKGGIKTLIPDYFLLEESWIILSTIDIASDLNMEEFCLIADQNFDKNEYKNRNIKHTSTQKNKR